jgi:hypothetical protein
VSEFPDWSFSRAHIERRSQRKDETVQNILL